MVRNWLVRHGRPYLDKNPAIKHAAVQVEASAGMVKHGVAAVMPFIIRPAPKVLTVAITAACNYACIGCRYGRDFMRGEYLKLDTIRLLFDDAAAAGMTTVRIYGGEPLVHPELPEMVSYAKSVGLLPYITTNGFLLERKIGALYEAGLRVATLGYYGSQPAYDEYTGKQGNFERFRKGLEAVRHECGSDFKMQLNYLLSRRSCSVEELERAWELICRYDMSLQIDLVHYSLPYFTEGPDQILQFRPEDEPPIRKFVDRLLQLKASAPTRMQESEASIRSIPDWLLKGPEMRVPCDAYNMIWVGADGTVQLCYVTFLLGNLHESRLRDLLFTHAHKKAAQDCFKLECPNCHCERSTRIAKHLPSRMRYAN
jgi:MoaA/NifB/PqqE/SkfB family radical SAM enzyme